MAKILQCSDKTRLAAKQQKNGIRTHTNTFKRRKARKQRILLVYAQQMLHISRRICMTLHMYAYLLLLTAKFLSFYYLYIVLNLIWHCRQLSPEHSPAFSPLFVLFESTLPPTLSCFTFASL